MDDLNVDALRHPVFRGRKYQRVKSFRKESQAKEYADELKQKIKSHRFPPIVEQVKIGWIFGYKYYVCVPKNMGVT